MISIKKMVVFLILLAAPGTGWAQNWTSNSLPFLYALWTGMSADGSVLVTASGDNGVYVSMDRGTTWTNTPQTATRYGGRAACSADGRKFFVLSGTDHFACSTNAGLSWFFATTNAPLMNGFMTVSADGNTLAGGGDSGLFTSTNGGMNWMTNFTGSWKCAACSGDGSKWIAGVTAGNTNGLVMSTNHGVTWTKINVPLNGWSSSVCSADGNTLVAAAYTVTPPMVYVSTNGGTSWTTNAGPSPYNALNLAGSADLRTLACWLSPSIGYIYVSTNLGVSWVTNVVPPDNWTQALATADGNRLVAFKNRAVWAATETNAPVVNFRQSVDGLVLSWTVPSTTLQLVTAEQVAGSWFVATNLASLNCSNLRYETTVPLTQTSGFFGLSKAGP